MISSIQVGRSLISSQSNSQFVKPGKCSQLSNFLLPHLLLKSWYFEQKFVILSLPSIIASWAGFLLTTLRDRKGLTRMNVLHFGFSSVGVVAEKGISLVAVNLQKMNILSLGSVCGMSIQLVLKGIGEPRPKAWPTSNLITTPSAGSTSPFAMNASC